MKNFRATWILAIIVLVAGVFTYRQYQKNQKSKGLQPHQTFVFDVKMDELRKVTFTEGDQSVVLEKDGTKWKLTSPVKDETDGYSVTSLLSRLTSAKATEVKDKDDTSKIDWKSYGLNPGTKITLQTQKGQSSSIFVSTMSAYDGGFFIKKGDELLLGQASWAHLANQSADTLRNHKILQSTGDIVEVKLDKHWDLKKDKKGWSLTPASKYPVDQNAVNAWLGTLRNLRASAFISENPDAKQLKETLGAQPAARFEIAFKDDSKTNNVTLNVGQNKKKDVYAQTSLRSTLYQMASSSLKDLTVEPKKFWDRKAPFQYPLEKVSRVELKNGKSKTVLVKKGSEWSVTAPKGVVVNHTGLTSFFQGLKGLSVTDFVPSSHGHFGFKADQEITLSNREGKVLFHMKWGQSTKDKKDLFVKVDGYKDVFTVAQMTLKDVLKEKLTQAKTSPSKSESAAKPDRKAHKK